MALKRKLYFFFLIISLMVPDLVCESPHLAGESILGLCPCTFFSINQAWEFSVKLQISVGYYFFTMQKKCFLL